ncbi:hypothetical protein D3C80_1300490 [compost metagenome]
MRREGKGEQHTAPTLEHGIARPVAATGQDDRLRGRECKAEAAHTSVTQKVMGGTLGEAMPPVNSPSLSLQRLPVEGRRIASRPNSGR